MKGFERPSLGNEELRKKVHEDVADLASDLRLAKKFVAQQRTAAAGKAAEAGGNGRFEKLEEIPESVLGTDIYRHFRELKSEGWRARCMRLYTERIGAMRQKGGPIAPQHEQAAFRDAMRETWDEISAASRRGKEEQYYQEKLSYRDPLDNEQVSA